MLAFVTTKLCNVVMSILWLVRPVGAIRHLEGNDRSAAIAVSRLTPALYSRIRARIGYWDFIPAAIIR